MKHTSTPKEKQMRVNTLALRLWLTLPLLLTGCDYFSKDKPHHTPLEVVWDVRLRDQHAPVSMAPAPLGNGDVVVCIFTDLYILDDRTGERKFHMDLEWGVPATKLLQDQSHFYVFTLRDVFAFRKSDYSIAWRTALPFFHHDGLGWYTGEIDNQFIYIPVRGGVIVLNKANGDVIRRYEIFNEFGQSQLASIINIRKRDNRLYIGAILGPSTLRTRIMCLDLATWEPIFNIIIPSLIRYPTGEVFEFNNDFAHMDFVAGNQLAVLTRGQLLALDPDTGEILQERVFGGPGSELQPSFFDTSFAHNHETIFVYGYNNGAFYAVNARTFDIEWGLPFRFSNTTGPVFLNGKVYVISSGALHVVDVQSRQVLGRIFHGQNNGRFVRMHVTRDFIYGLSLDFAFKLRNFR